MAARPPVNDDDGPDVVEFGIPAVETHLDAADLTYPVDSETLVAVTGDPEVPVNTRGRSIRLSTALERTGREQFDSRRDLLNALHPVLEDARQSGAAGVLGYVRSLIPNVLK
ncbi:hypothetical protein [Halarchaeum sp. P4]|uniref:DUF5789 family protein n=1 Tax=Halarchaeum sp. P4 TaxID=3421639 RepID=UPI003EBD063C